MSRKILSRAIALVGAVALIIMWIALHRELGLSESEIYISEHLVNATHTSWTVNLDTGHRTFRWGNVSSELQVAVIPGRPAPPPSPKYNVIYSKGERAEIISELQALGWFSLWTVSKPTLHIEYRLNNEQSQFDYVAPYPEEVQNLLQSLQINRGPDGFN